MKDPRKINPKEGRSFEEECVEEGNMYYHKNIVIKRRINGRITFFRQAEFISKEK